MSKKNEKHEVNVRNGYALAAKQRRGGFHRVDRRDGPAVEEWDDSDVEEREDDACFQ